MQKKLTVSQLNKYIKGVFEDELILHNLSIEGEVVEYKKVGNAAYFVLKDEDCVLNCVSFSQVMGVDAGARITVFGRVEFYAKNGKVSFVAKSITLSGEGLWLARQKKLREQLEKEGVFSNNRGLPRFIKKAALITSGEGAVLYDFISVIRRLAPYIEVKIFSVKVQGSGASEQIMQAMHDITCEKYEDFDIIVLARGGGSMMDLSEFNNEDLARSIHASKLTVVSAIGHETDYTLADFAADIRAGTPSIAAEIISNNNNTFLNKIFNTSLDNALKTTQLLNNKYRLLIKQARISDSNTQSIIHSCKKRLLNRQILYNVETNFAKKESVFKQLVAKIEAANPLKLLTDGYSKIVKDGKNITSTKQINAGDNIDIFVSDGKLEAKIEKIT